MKTKASFIWYLVFCAIVTFIVYLSNGNNEDIEIASVVLIIIFMGVCLFAIIPTIKIAIIISSIPFFVYLIYLLNTGGNFHFDRIIIIMSSPLIILFLISHWVGGCFKDEIVSLKSQVKDIPQEEISRSTKTERIIYGYQLLHLKSFRSLKLFFSNIRELCGLKDRSVTGVLLENIAVILEEISDKTLLDTSIVYNPLHEYINNNQDKITGFITNIGIEHLALVFIKQSLDNGLCSGQYHVYRGVLGIQGREFKEAYRIVNDKMIDKGYITEEVKNADLKSINIDINCVG